MLSLLNLIDTLLYLFSVAVIISVILSWLYQFNIINSRNQFVDLISNFFYRVTEPALKPIRKVVPTLGGIDISPLLLLLGLFFLRSLLREYWPR